MSLMSPELRGKHVLVTGGTKGIGKGIVEGFLKEGANVSYCARTLLGNEFPSTSNDDTSRGRAVGSAVDLASADAVEKWIHDAAEQFGGIDVVISNATSHSVAATRESWQNSFNIDMLSLITILDTTMPYLAKAGGRGSVVVMGSMAGFEARHSSPYGPYPTLKRAQVTLAKSYVRKLAPHGIRINCILPGFIETPGITLPDGTVEPSRVELARKNNGAYIDSIVESIPLKRPGTVEDVAKAAVFLGSPLSSYITGAHLVMDGGMSIIL